MAVQITENSPEDTAVATISAVGGTAPFVFTITAQERANWFKIVGDELQVGSGGIDYETDASPTVTIQVEDDHGYTFSKTFTIPVTDIADDTTPDAFAFTDITGAIFSTLYTSNTITVAGINAPAAISITGGTYKINAGSYVSSPGTVSNGDTVTVRVTSSGSPSTAVNAVLTIGGVSDTYTVTTGASEATSDANVVMFVPFTADYNDHGPNAFSATVHGSPSRTDRMITSANSDYIEFGAVDGGLSTASAWTIDFRLKTSTNDSSPRAVLMWGTTQYEVGVFLYQGDLYFYNRALIGDVVNWPTPGAINDGTERHFALMWTGAAYWWFVDGVASSIGGNVTNFLGNVDDWTKFLVMQEPAVGSNRNPIGEIDDIRLSKIAQYSTGGFTVPARGYGY